MIKLGKRERFNLVFNVDRGIWVKRDDKTGISHVTPRPDKAVWEPFEVWGYPVIAEDPADVDLPVRIMIHRKHQLVRDNAGVAISAKPCKSGWGISEFHTSGCLDSGLCKALNHNSFMLWTRDEALKIVRIFLTEGAVIDGKPFTMKTLVETIEKMKHYNSL